MTGIPTAIMIVTPWLPVPVALVALTVALNVPMVVGVPDTSPVTAFTLRPGGKPLAP